MKRLAPHVALLAAVVALAGGPAAIADSILGDGGPNELMGTSGPDGLWGEDGDDDGGDPAAAALRELEEEAGMRIEDVEELVPFSRWITPEEVSIRFDTFFYVAAAPPGAEPRIDGAECVGVQWIRPADALAAGERGELMLVFPTIKHLEQLAKLDSVEHALATARDRDVQPILPKVVGRDGEAHVLLPGEPGYPNCRHDARNPRPRKGLVGR